MKKSVAYYLRLVGELVVFITISLMLGTALHHVMNERPSPKQPTVRQAQRQSTPSHLITKGPLYAEPSIDSESQKTDPTPVSRSTPDRQAATHSPKNPVPIPTGITARMVTTVRALTTPSPLVTPPTISPAAMVPLARPVEDIPAVPEEEPPMEELGDLLISGYVLTESGEPVFNLEVTATVDRVFENDTQRVRYNQTYQARTDFDGEFEFPQLFGGEYTLRTTPAPPYQATSKRVRAGMEDVTLVVAETRSLKVQGLVTQADSGAPLAGITVAAASHMTATDDAGRYTLAILVAGRGQSPTRLQFTHPNYWDQGITVPLSHSQTDMPLILKDVAMEAMEGRAEVSGVVESQIDEKPLANMRVFLAPAKGRGQQDTLTAQDGTFHFPKVAWGTYTLVVVPKTGYQDLTHPNLQVTDAGVEDLHLQLASMPTSQLTGQFVDSTGQPVRGLTLFLTSRTVRTFTGKSVTSDPSGYFSMQDVPAGEVEFTTSSAPNLTITGLTLQPGAAAAVTLPVDWGFQTLTGQVVTAGGLPLPGAEISLIWSQTAHGLTSHAIRHNTADSTGTFHFTQLGPGQHTLNVSAPGYTRSLVEHAVGPDQPTVQVTLVARPS